jgi:hypothetical protein
VGLRSSALLATTTNDYGDDKIFASLNVFSETFSVDELSQGLGIVSESSMGYARAQPGIAYWALRSPDFGQTALTALETAIISLVERIPLTGRQWLLSRVTEGTVRARITVFLGIGSRELHMSSGFLQRLADLQLDVELDIYTRD